MSQFYWHIPILLACPTGLYSYTKYSPQLNAVYTDTENHIIAYPFAV